MNTLLKKTSLYLLVSSFLFSFLNFDVNVSAQSMDDDKEYYKISTQNAAISSATPASGSLAASAFDGNESTAFVTAEVTHAFVQVAFTQAQSVSKVKVLIGEPGYDYIKNDWWVEAADTLTDLQYQTGSYKLVVDTQLDANGNWKEYDLDESVSKKVWRISAKKKIWNNQVNFAEIELWGNYKKIDILEQYSTLDALITNTHRGGAYLDNRAKENMWYMRSCFDDSIYNYAEILEGDSAFAQIEFSKSKNINLIKVHNYDQIIQNQNMIIELANTEQDLKNKSGSYHLINSTTYEITDDNWIKVYIPNNHVDKSFVKFTFSKASTAQNIIFPEIELWTDDNVAPTVPTNLMGTALDARTVELKWTASTDNDKVSGYKVYRNDSYIGTSVTNQFTDTLLTPSTTYTYKLHAFDAAGNTSAFTGSISRTTTNLMQIKKNYNVLVLYYDPIVKAGDYMGKVVPQDIKYSDLYSLNLNPINERVQEYTDNMKRVSGGSVNYNVVDIREINTDVPVNCPDWMNSHMMIEAQDFKQPGKDYDVFHLGGFSYPKAFRDNNVLPMIEKNIIDFVWIYTTPPYTGVSESSMFGREAYFSNGITFSNIACSRKFLTLIGDSYESFGHHIDNGSKINIFSRLPKKTNANVLISQDTNNRSTYSKNINDWERFELTESLNYDADSVSPGFSQVGNMHFPANAVREYGWGHVEDRFYSDNDWNKIEGFWNVSSEMYTVNTSSTAKTTMTWSTGFTSNRPIMAKNSIIETDIRINSSAQGSRAGVIFRATNHENSGFSFNGYYAGINPYDNKVFIARTNNNAYSEIDSVNMPIAINTNYRLKVVTDEQNIKVYLNDMNTPVLEANNSAFLQSGTVGYLVTNANVSFDNFYMNSVVKSYADTWYSYPNLNGSPSNVTFDDWDGDNVKYHLWVFDHIPRNPGMHNATDISTNQVFQGVLNNWWPYIVDFNRFDATPITYQVTGFPVPPVANPKLEQVNNYIKLSWLTPENSGITGCKIYRNGVFLGNSTNGEFVDTNATPYTLYSYTIKSYNSSGLESIEIDIPKYGYIGGDYVKVNTNEAVLSSVQGHEGTQASSAFDGNVDTKFITANVENVYIQAAFNEAKTVSRIRALIGETGYDYIKNDWWVEAADTLSDLTNKTGSYQLVVDTQYDINGNWHEVDLSEPVTKKIWRINAKKKIWDNHVHFAEVELWNFEDISKELSLDAAELSSCEGNLGTNVGNAFDSNENTSFVSANVEHAYVQMYFTNGKTVTKVKSLIGEIGYSHITNDWWLEAADSLADLTNKTGSYKLVIDTQYDAAGAWQEANLKEATTKKYWRVNAKKKVFDNNVNFVEIKLWGIE